MELIATAVTKKLPVDSWKMIIEFFMDEITCTSKGFEPILLYRLISKTFRDMVLECIRELHINGASRNDSILKMMTVILSRPISLQQIMVPLNNQLDDEDLFYDLICGCKNLKGLSIVVWETSMTPVTLIGRKGLRQIGDNCTKIERLNLTGRTLHLPLQLPSFLSSFIGLRKLSIAGKCITVPPSNMQDWSDLRFIGGDSLLDDPVWSEAISILPNLEEIRIRSDMICDENIFDFCRMCKDKSICKTLKVFESSAVYRDRQNSEGMTDDGFYSVIDAFPNLRVIILEVMSVTLKRPDIVHKLGNLNQLVDLRITRSDIFFNANINLINEWLQTKVLYFPKCLETIQFIDCKVLNNINVVKYHQACSISGTIMSAFDDALPNLRKIDVTFYINEEENSYSYDDAYWL